MEVAVFMNDHPNFTAAPTLLPAPVQAPSRCCVHLRRQVELNKTAVDSQFDWTRSERRIAMGKKVTLARIVSTCYDVIICCAEVFP